MQEKESFLWRLERNLYLSTIKQTQTKMNNPLATRIATMSTGQIKNTLETMNRKPWAQWSKDELTVENALIFELYDRNEEEWCARYEETMSL